MKAWENFLALQEIELGAATVNKWLRPLKVVRFDAGNLYLEAKDSFQTLWFEEHIRQKTKTKLLNTSNKPIKVHLSLPNAGRSEPEQKTQKDNTSPTAPFRLHFNPLDPAYSFKDLIVSQENALTTKVIAESVGYALESQQIVDTSSNTPLFNPIYVHGPSGTGKTHLLIAAAHTLRQRGRNVIYVQAETFTDHVVMAIRAAEMSIFRQAYRNADVLIIDDVHVFSRKGATQEEFFHTFNTLHMAGKLILMSANCPPSDLQHIEPRLVSRFEWGIALPLVPLKKAEILTILEKKALFLNFALRSNIAEYLVNTFKGTSSVIRALEALILRTHLNKQTPHFSSTTLTIPIVAHTLKDLILEEEQNALTPQKIIKTVAENYGITTEDILSKSQSRECTLPRQIAMHLCRHELNIPFIKIGDLFSRDHSTVMTSVRRIQKALESEETDIVPVYRHIHTALNAK